MPAGDCLNSVKKWETTPGSLRYNTGKMSLWITGVEQWRDLFNKVAEKSCFKAYQPVVGVDSGKIQTWFVGAVARN
jgi:hypothetical protein